MPDPDFQRRLVWSNKDKISFVETVLLGYPFPEIYTAAGTVDTETGDGNELLVDGQQRMTTLLQYFNGSEDLKLRGKIRPYKDLADEEKRHFLDYEVVIRDLGSKSNQQIKEIFERINSTKYSLNAMEIHNARFEGAFKLFAEEIAQHMFFEQNNVFRATEIRRMSDTRFCLTFIITIMSNYFNRDSSLEEYLANYNDEFEAKDDLRREIGEVFSFIDRCSFGARSRAWKKADLLTLLVEIYRMLSNPERKKSARLVGNRIKKFYEQVDSVDDKQENDKDILAYNQAIIQASNDRSSRIKRGEIMAKVIDGDWPESSD